MIEQSEQVMEQDPAVLRAAAESALDELTASLTQVLKAVNRVHRAVSRLGGVVDAGANGSHKDAPTADE
jgi:hypothetical protein